ncbi:MAG: hypothetical protein LV480_05945 [Methylacidiphilales bacterium]|nr:hypothetical protein [Candidatus Methylacidiphilales bacterium]
MRDLYIQHLRQAFLRLHEYEARHVETVPAIERFKGKTVCEGDVEVFDLISHPKAKRGYARAYNKKRGSDTIAVLELPPAISPKTAVQATIVSGEQK